VAESGSSAGALGASNWRVIKVGVFTKLVSWDENHRVLLLNNHRWTSSTPHTSAKACVKVSVTL
jgi:hypothetical protein